MKSLADLVKDYENQKRKLEETVDLLNDENAKLKVQGKLLTVWEFFGPFWKFHFCRKSGRRCSRFVGRQGPRIRAGIASRSPYETSGVLERRVGGEE